MSRLPIKITPKTNRLLPPNLIYETIEPIISGKQNDPDVLTNYFSIIVAMQLKQMDMIDTMRKEMISQQKQLCDIRKSSKSENTIQSVLEGKSFSSAQCATEKEEQQLNLEENYVSKTFLLDNYVNRQIFNESLNHMMNHTLIQVSKTFLKLEEYTNHKESIETKVNKIELQINSILRECNSRLNNVEKQLENDKLKYLNMFNQQEEKLSKLSDDKSNIVIDDISPEIINQDVKELLETQAEHDGDESD